MIGLPILLVKLVALLLSLVVAYLAYYGYRRNGSHPMLYVSVGFVFIGIGAICEGLIYSVLDTSLFSAALIQVALVSSGMLFILGSLLLGPDS